MTIKFTEKELQQALKNNARLKISQDSNKNNIDDKKINVDKCVLESKKISVVGESSAKKGATSLNQKVSEINKRNRESKVSIEYSEEHFSLLFEGAQLLSINQIFNKLQNQKAKFEIFQYKKNWHNIIKKILGEQFIISKSKNVKLPYFDNNVEVTLFRQAKRLVDEDATTVMFKFIIDALKRNETDNPYGIIAEDNPKIISKITTYNEKGYPFVGIRIQKAKEIKLPFSAEMILGKV